MAGDSSIGENAPKKSCRGCKNIPQSGLVCVKCDSLSHPSCVKRLKYIKYIDNDHIICCEEKPTDADITGERQQCLSQENDEADSIECKFKVAEVENKYLRSIVLHKEQIICELNEKVALLRDKIDLLEKVNLPRVAPSKPQSRETHDRDGTRTGRQFVKRAEDGAPGQTNNEEKEQTCQSVNVGDVNRSKNRKQKSRADGGDLTGASSSVAAPGVVDGTEESTEVVVVGAAENVKDCRTENPTAAGGQFQVVNNNRRKRKHRDVFIVGKGSDGSEGSLRPAERRTWIFVTRLHKDTTTDDVKSYLDKVCNVQCEKLTSLRNSDRVASFKVSAPLRFQDDLMRAELWPEGVRVCRYRFRRGGGEDGVGSENFQKPPTQNNSG